MYKTFIRYIVYLCIYLECKKSKARTKPIKNQLINLIGSALIYQGNMCVYVCVDIRQNTGASSNLGHGGRRRISTKINIYA